MSAAWDLASFGLGDQCLRNRRGGSTPWATSRSTDDRRSPDICGGQSRPDGKTAHYSTGFVILHHGSGAKSLLTQWWANECVCLQHVAQSAYVGRPSFVEAKNDLMACAYELVPIDFERRAWVSTVMSGKPMSDYLDAWLPDGTY